MKKWYKIIVIAVIGAFLFPNAVKLLHHCEHEQHHCCSHESDDLGYDQLKSGADQHLNAQCLICNFQYSGFHKSNKVSVSAQLIVLSEFIPKAVSAAIVQSHYNLKNLRAPPVLI